MPINEVEANGWTAVPIDAMQLFNGKTYRHVPEALLVADMKFPSDDPLVAKVQAYAKEKLPEQTFNHSMRVFYFGMRSSSVVARVGFGHQDHQN